MTSFCQEPFRDGWNNENPTKKGARDMSAEFQMVEIDRLYESATNPRRKFHGLEELTASVKQHGVLTPLLVRPAAGTDGNLEIIAGARRYRAATAAKITGIPVRIKEMSDHEALELQIIENLQRRDVHPLDEGLGYKRLEAMGDTVEDIAAKVNKSESYVYQRMKLAALTESWQELFLADEITPGHAVQIARLNPQHQKELLRDMKKTEEMTVRQLGEHIANNYHLRLADSPFPLDDATLLPAAGACKTCPKRSGANPLLFPDVKAKDTCADPICFNQKVTAFVALQTEANPEALKLSIGHHFERKPQHETEWVVARGKKCESTTQAVLAEVLDPYAAKREKLKLGQVVSICTDKKCKEHHQQIPERDGYKKPASQKKLEKARKVELKRRAAIFQAMMLRDAEPPTKAEWEQALKWTIDGLAFDQGKAVCDAMGWTPKKDRFNSTNPAEVITTKLRATDNPAAAVYCLMLAGAELSFYVGEKAHCNNLEAAAKRRGVDLKAITKQLEEPEKKPEPKAKAEPKPPKAKKPAKAKKAKKKAA